MKDMWDICHIMKYELIELHKRIPGLLLFGVVVIGLYQLKQQQNQIMKVYYFQILIPLEILDVEGTPQHLSLSTLTKLLLILWQVHKDKATNVLFSKESRYEIADSRLQLGAVTLAHQTLLNWPLSRLCHYASGKEMAEKVLLGLKTIAKSVILSKQVRIFLLSEKYREMRRASL